VINGRVQTAAVLCAA